LDDSINFVDLEYESVIKDGYFIYSWGAFSKRHNWASAAKPGVSTMLLAAISEGKVKSPDSPPLPVLACHAAD
jgi:hypothetical protein